MSNYIDELDQHETLEMLKEIDNNYKDLKLKIPKPKYDALGVWKNEKEIKQALKEVSKSIVTLWTLNDLVVNSYSKNTIKNNLLYYSLLKTKGKNPKRMITEKEWQNIMRNLLKKRQDKIKIKQVMRGNALKLNKKVQNLVNDMYKNGYSWVDTQRALQKEFGYNKAKAKSIAITEKNYYKSEAQLKATDGMNIYKTWIYNYKAKESRGSHVDVDGKRVLGRDNYFNVGGYKTLAPQHFGIASEDINCHCTMRIDLVENIKLSKKEIEEILKD